MPSRSRADPPHQGADPFRAPPPQAPGRPPLKRWGRAHRLGAELSRPRKFSWV